MNAFQMCGKAREIGKSAPTIMGSPREGGRWDLFQLTPSLPEEVDKARRAHNAIGRRSHIKALHVCPVPVTLPPQSVECISLAFSEQSQIIHLKS